MKSSKHNYIILSIFIIFVLFSCTNTDERGGFGVSRYDTEIVDNNPIPSPNEFNNEITNDNETEDMETGEETTEDTNQDEVVSEDDNSVKIGFLYQNSGNLKTIADQMSRGFEIGLEYMTGGEMTVLEGRPVKILYRDTEGNPEIGKNHLIDLYENENVVLAIGSTSNEVTRELIPIAELYKKILLIEPAYTDDLTGELWNEYIFKSSPNIYQRAMALAMSIDYTEDFKPILITEASESGRLAYEAIMSVFDDNEVSVSKRYEIDTGKNKVSLDTTIPGQGSWFDIIPYVQNIEEDIQNGDITHIIIFWDINSYSPMAAGQYSPAFALLDNQVIEDNGVKIVTEIPSITILKTIGNAEGLIGSSYYYYNLADWDMNYFLIEKSQERYMTDAPDSYMCMGFTVASVAIEVIKRSSGDFSTDTLIGLLKGKTFETPKGFITYREEDHQALQDMLTVELVMSEDVNWSAPVYFGEGEIYAFSLNPPVRNKN